MELKEGYKQTEVGVIPEDWRVILLNECVKLGAPICYGILMPGKGHAGGIPVIKVKDIIGGRILQNKLLLTSPEIHEQYRRSKLREGDLLITIRGSTGRVAIVPPILDGANITQDTARVRLSDRVSSPFVYFVSQTPVVKEQVSLHTLGLAVKGINIADVKRLPLPLPPTKAEQEAIAEALSDADALIDSLEQLIAKKRQIKQGAMQELLTGKKRLPGFTGEWEEHRLGQLLLSPPGYGINAAATFATGNLPTYLRITDIDDYGNFRKENRVAVDHPAAENYYLNEDEIVFARTGASVGKSYLYKPSDGKIVFAGFLIRAKIDASKLNPLFFYNYTTTADYWDWVQVMSMRSGQPGINGSEFATMEILMPPTTDEQTAIATILSDMDAEVTALETKLTKAWQVKQGMMQELLTGKIRLI